MNKCIVIGCDNSVHMPVILNGIRDANAGKHTIITSPRFSDLLKIVRSVEPDLFIFCFRDNQQALLNFNDMVKKPRVPVLCITSAYESEIISWESNSIVFTCRLDHLSQAGYLQSRINSILLLQSESTVAKPGTFAQSAQIGTPAGGMDLGRYVLELDQKINILAQVKERIAGLYPKVDNPIRIELSSIVNSIKNSINDRKIWSDFKLLFEQTDPHFLYQIAKLHPDLTSIDLKYCCYIKMNMSNDDIKDVLGISQESVRTHKYRLKKKLTLKKEQILETYLRAVGNEEVLNQRQILSSLVT